MHPDKITWPLRLAVDKNTVDYLLVFTAITSELSVSIPLLNLPPAVRQLSLVKQDSNTEARIIAAGEALIYESLLAAAGHPLANPNISEIVATELSSLIEESFLHLPADIACSPLQIYLHQRLGLDGVRKKIAPDFILAMERLLSPQEVTARESSKAVATLLRDDVERSTELIEVLFPRWDDEYKSQIAARFQRVSSPTALAFLLRQLAMPDSETYAEGIVVGLAAHQSSEVLEALHNYINSSRSHSPRTLARVAGWMGNYPGNGAIVPLQELLASSSPQVVRAANKGLRQQGLERPAVLALVEKRLVSQNLPDRATAWIVLEDFTWSTPEEQDFLWQLFLQNLEKYPLAGVSGMASIILKNLPGEVLINRLSEGLQHPKGQVRAGMLFLVERLRNKQPDLIKESFIRKLILLLVDKDFDVRRVIGHLLSSLLRRPLSSSVTSDLLKVYELSSKNSERQLTVIGCWLVLFQHNDFDGRIEDPLLASINDESTSRAVLLAAWRLLRNSTNDRVKGKMVRLRQSGKLKKKP